MVFLYPMHSLLQSLPPIFLAKILTRKLLLQHLSDAPAPADVIAVTSRCVCHHQALALDIARRRDQRGIRTSSGIARNRFDAVGRNLVRPPGWLFALVEGSGGAGHGHRKTCCGPPDPALWHRCSYRTSKPGKAPTHFRRALPAMRVPTGCPVSR